MALELQTLWKEVDFTPNAAQEEAIRHVDGPLFLPAGPGSGKTRVLLWRTLNLIVFHDVPVEEIFLSTFTEKAALQLKQGLEFLLGLVSNRTNQAYDLSGMYIGTVHSLCQRILQDRRFSADHVRTKRPVLLDELGQFFYVRRALDDLVNSAACEYADINRILAPERADSPSKYLAVTNLIKLFNRFSEEHLDPEQCALACDNELLRSAFQMYANYKNMLSDGGAYVTDFSLLQSEALRVLQENPKAPELLNYIIVDEYQDTNAIQEKIFFKLASNNTNLCVVGDDDQALYRFRGATVENFVEFPQRCVEHFGSEPRAIPLSTNYRSRKRIVDFYTQFIDYEDWRKADGAGAYRVQGKNITPHSADSGPSVVVTSNVNREDSYTEIVEVVKSLLDAKHPKIHDPSQIAFLFPSMKSWGKPTKPVETMKRLLEEAGFKVYAPRAGRFLEVEEAVPLFGLYAHIFGRPERSAEFSGIDYNGFHDWIDRCYSAAEELIKADSNLKTFIADRCKEIDTATRDNGLLRDKIDVSKWDLDSVYDPDTMKVPLANIPGLSQPAKNSLTNKYMARIVQRRIEAGNPVTLKYIVNSATALDWNVLDLFYRLLGFSHFRAMFDLAEGGEDEGPVCNLGLISQYLARYLDEYSPMLTGSFLSGDTFQRVFYMTFLFSVFRLGEGEFEDTNDPFPRGRIPFLTVHQSKGLEFPVVVLPSVSRKDHGVPVIEKIIEPFVAREGEPLDRMGLFDTMRLFYVALSRAENLLLIGNPRGQGISTNAAFKQFFEDHPPLRIPNFDASTVPMAKVASDDLPRRYSYTADYLQYEKCPRQYMIFRKYGFVPSRSQTQFFGSLVHSTLEDLHHLLIQKRELQKEAAA